MALRFAVLTLAILSPRLMFAQTLPADSSIVKSMPRMSDPWFGKDKADHVMLSAALTAVQYYGLHRELELSSRRSLRTAALSTLAVGVAKEIYDATARKRFASKKDLVADVLGIAITVILINK